MPALVAVTSAEAMDASDVRELLWTALRQDEGWGSEEEAMQDTILHHVVAEWGGLGNWDHSQEDIDRAARAITRRFDLLPAEERGV